MNTLPCSLRKWKNSFIMAIFAAGSNCRSVTKCVVLAQRLVLVAVLGGRQVSRQEFES